MDTEAGKLETSSNIYCILITASPFFISGFSHHLGSSDGFEFLYSTLSCPICPPSSTPILHLVLSNMSSVFNPYTPPCPVQYVLRLQPLYSTLSCPICPPPSTPILHLVLSNMSSVFNPYTPPCPVQYVLCLQPLYSNLSCPICPPPLTLHFPYIFYSSLSTWLSVFLSVSFLVLVHLPFFLARTLRPFSWTCSHITAICFKLMRQEFATDQTVMTISVISITINISTIMIQQFFKVNKMITRLEYTSLFETSIKCSRKTNGD